LAATPHEVEVIRLADLCDAHVKDRTIDFMKIDVEGGELGVLQSGDWERYRPRLLITISTCARRTWSGVALSGCRRTFSTDSKPPRSPN